LAYHLAC